MQVLASNMIFLGVVIFVPFSLGRIILYYLSWLLSSASNPVLSTVMPLTETALSLANITLKSAWTAVANLTPTANEESSLLGQVTEMLKANATGLSEAANNLSTTVSTDLMKGSSVGTSRLSDVTTLAVGYMFIFSLVFFLPWDCCFNPIHQGRAFDAGKILWYCFHSRNHPLPL